MFDGITGSYDGLNRLMSFSLDRRWRRLALDRLDARDGELVLDVATGTGDMALLAASRHRCRLVGLDLSRNMMMSAAEKWSREARNTEYLPVQGDAAAMPFRDGAFDRTMVAFGVRNMVDMGRFFSEAGRTLRRGGRLVVLELSVPVAPVVRQVFSMYLIRALPVMARAMGGDKAAYRYLTRSILTFPPPEKVEAMIRSSGFRIVSSEPLTLGSCHLYTAEKL